MKGKIVAFFLVIFPLLFGVTLYYSQYYAYYEKVSDVTSIMVEGRAVAVADYEGIDASSSSLKMRGCFTVDPADFEGVTVAANPTPLTPPNWFTCYDVETLSHDLEAGKATAYLAQKEDRDGLDLIVAVYPDGRAFQWRQLNDKYQDE
jgi:hypothetical protein